MCLAIPMKITKIDGTMAIVIASGLARSISIEFLDTVNVGDYVMVHAGFAIQKVDEREAHETLNFLKEISHDEIR